jgi:RNA polymerase sigma-70 factor, ECF subfamily
VMTNLIDSYLIFRIRTKRDPEAFARIYDRYVEAIYRFAILKLPGKEEAQDVTAETFTRAWQYLNEQKGVAHMRALLYRIARNLIADFYRSLPQQPPLSIDAISSNDAAVTNQGDFPSHSLEGSISDQKSGKRLLEARADLGLILQRLERLKEDYRDVLTLRLIDDLPFDVIAEILEKKSGHVRVIYHRALKALKDLEPEK